LLKGLLKGLLSGFGLSLFHVPRPIPKVNKYSSFNLYWYKPYKSISIFYRGIDNSPRGCLFLHFV
jgi:hypothetical protein